MKAKAESDSVIWNPLQIASHPAKTGFIALVTVASFITAYFIAAEAANKEFFYTSPLSACQVSAFLWIVSLFLWYGAYLFVVRRDMVTHDEDFRTASRRHLNDDSAASLAAAAEYAAYMLLFYLCDRTTWIPRSKKKYDKDVFWMLWSLLCLAAFATLVKAKPPKHHAPPLPPPVPQPAAVEMAAAAVPAADGSNTTASTVVAVLPPQAAPVTAENANFHVALLQRDQTEEWKGWMQVMFLWYHYFEAKDLYNAIRLYIAAYVWMTGFGNFSYYYVKRDFSFSRFAAMMWRLNFMVIGVCAVLNNEYMLYYICPLHTIFTLMIYVGLGTLPQYNTTTLGISIKFGLLFVVSFIVWDIKGVFEVVWAPLTSLVQYHDPYKPDRPLLHEWQFRSFLDHYIWMFGMLVAFNHPRLDQWLQHVDAMPLRKGNAVKLGVAAASIAALYVYYDNVFSLPKSEYNKLHPYTSWIPIGLFIVLRNISATARRYHLHLFEYLGKITLETYIAQFHIWMATTGVNGAPKKLLRLLPANWPLMNFLLFSALYFFVSLRLFHCTNALKSFVLPSKATKEVLQRNLVFLVLAVTVSYFYGGFLLMLVNRYSAPV